jgi:hypothetical protein
MAIILQVTRKAENSDSTIADTYKSPEGSDSQGGGGSETFSPTSVVSPRQRKSASKSKSSRYEARPRGTRIKCCQMYFQYCRICTTCCQMYIHCCQIYTICFRMNIQCCQIYTKRCQIHIQCLPNASGQTRKRAMLFFEVGDSDVRF